MAELSWAGYVFTRTEMQLLLHLATHRLPQWFPGRDISHEEGVRVCRQLCSQGAMISTGEELIVPRALQQMLLALTESSDSMLTVNRKNTVLLAHSGSYWIIAINGERQLWQLLPVQTLTQATEALHDAMHSDLSYARVTLTQNGKARCYQLDDLWHEELLSIWNRLCRWINSRDAHQADQDRRST